VAFSEQKIESMYEAAKEKSASENVYGEQVLQTLQTQLDGLKAKESLLLDTFLVQQISKDLYNAKILALHNDRIALDKQIQDTKAKQPLCVLEPTKKVFLEASRAKKEFQDGDDFKKRNILENLCWNLSIKEKNIHTVSLKSPFDIMFKADKNADFKTMCEMRESSLTDSVQSSRARASQARLAHMLRLFDSRRDARRRVAISHKK
jgi:hypothetical protein